MLPDRYIYYWDFLRKDARSILVAAGILLLFILYSLLHTIAVLIVNHQANLNLTNAPMKTVTFSPIAVQQDIAEFHLFGMYNQNLDSLPKTQLQLILQGVGVSVLKDGISEAILVAPGQSSKVYHVGDTVPGGAIIKKIEKQRIILDDNGRLETLSLPIRTLTNSGSMGR